MDLFQRLKNGGQDGVPLLVGFVRRANNPGFASLDSLDGVENGERLVAPVRELTRPASHGGGLGFSRDDNESSHGESKYCLRFPRVTVWANLVRWREDLGRVARAAVIRDTDCAGGDAPMAVTTIELR